MATGEIREPSFPKDYESARKPLPKTSPNSIPPKTEIKPFANLPASTQPKPLKGALDK
jgi:hypothetical protein